VLPVYLVLFGSCKLVSPIFAPEQLSLGAAEQLYRSSSILHFQSIQFTDGLVSFKARVLYYGVVHVLVQYIPDIGTSRIRAISQKGFRGVRLGAKSVLCEDSQGDRMPEKGCDRLDFMKVESKLPNRGDMTSMRKPCG
jgi:hypothetical protein